MSEVIKFQEKLLSDPDFRKKFAENPQEVLKDLGIELPVGVKVPQTIDLEILEVQAKNVNEGLEVLQTTIGDIDPEDGHAVIRVVEESIPLRTREVLGARRVFEELTLSRKSPGDVATVAVIAAVVAAVVAVPVAVFGASERLKAISSPASGILGVSRGNLGTTLHGPNGLRVEGLSPADISEIIKNVR